MFKPFLFYDTEYSSVPARAIGTNGMTAQDTFLLGPQRQDRPDAPFVQRVCHEFDAFHVHAVEGV